MSSPENNPNSQEKGPILLNTLEEMDSLIKRIIQTHPNATLEQLSLFGRQYYGNPKHSKQLTLYNQALARIKNRFVEADEKITPPTQTKQSPPTQTTSPQPTPPQPEKPAVPKTKPPIPNHRPALATLWPLSLIACTGLTVVLAISRADTNKPLFSNPNIPTPTPIPTLTPETFPCAIHYSSAKKYNPPIPGPVIENYLDTGCGVEVLTHDNGYFPNPYQRIYQNITTNEIAIINPHDTPKIDGIGNAYFVPTLCFNPKESVPKGICETGILFIATPTKN